MNETIATLANTTIQDVIDDERIERLVRQIIEETSRLLKISPPASSIIDNTIFNRKTSVVEYKKYTYKRRRAKKIKKIILPSQT